MSKLTDHQAPIDEDQTLDQAERADLDASNPVDREILNGIARRSREHAAVSAKNADIRRALQLKNTIEGASRAQEAELREAGREVERSRERTRS